MPLENESVEDLTTKRVVITGASSGIGRAAAVEMARRGWKVTLVGRNKSRLDEALRQVHQAGDPDAQGHLADFTVLDQVREVAAALAGQRIDVLANNAGLIVRGSTVDGFDATMQINHIAPFLLTSLLRPQLPDGARIVSTSSMASAFGSDPARLTRRFLSTWHAYGTSKKANILFAAEIARRWPTLHGYSFHPGVVRTNFGTPLARIFYRITPGLGTAEQGADQLVWLSTAPLDELTEGGFYSGRKLMGPARDAKAEAAAARLWETTASLVGLA